MHNQCKVKELASSRFSCLTCLQSVTKQEAAKAVAEQPKLLNCNRAGTQLGGNVAPGKLFLTGPLTLAFVDIASTVQDQNKPRKMMLDYIVQTELTYLLQTDIYSMYLTSVQYPTGYNQYRQQAKVVLQSKFQALSTHNDVPI